MSYRSRYLAGDPRWITARRPGVCRRDGCERPVAIGERVFYYPKGSAVYCAECSPAVAARAEAELADDDTYGAW